MNINLTDALIERIVSELRPIVIATVQKSINSVIHNDSHPYLNRREMAKYLGVAESTVSAWVSIGMPVATIDGRKLYGKKTVTQWLKSHEMTVESQCQHQKSPQLLQ